MTEKYNISHLFYGDHSQERRGVGLTSLLSDAELEELYAEIMLDDDSDYE